MLQKYHSTPKFPFLFGGTFIEEFAQNNFSIFQNRFPFLFGGTFIEDVDTLHNVAYTVKFPFLFGGTFIEDGCLAGRIPP